MRYYIITALHDRPCFITGEDELPAVFSSAEAAHECATDQIICKAYGYQVIGCEGFQIVELE